MRQRGGQSTGLLAILLAASACHASEPGGLDDLIGQFGKFSRATPEERAEARRKLDAIPDWRERVARRIHALVEQEELVVAWQDANDKLNALGRGPSWTPEAIAQSKALRLEQEQIEEQTAGKRSPQAEAYSWFNCLRGMNDPKATVPLIALALQAQGRTIYDSDSSVPSLQQRAADALIIMNLPGAPKGADVDKWRAWWALNQANYEPIPLTKELPPQRALTTPPPVVPPDSVVKAAATTTATAAAQEQYRHPNYLYIGLGILALLVGGMLWRTLSRRSSRPVTRY